MQYCEFMFQGERLQAFANGALYWPRKQLLAVADLHLGKSARMARTGRSLFPPYELIDTLGRLAAEANSVQPRVLVCLGDSFDDNIAATELGDRAEQKLKSILHGRRCVWISGNHDPRARRADGLHASEYKVPPLVFRHVASSEGRGEVTGHFHPKIAIKTKAGSFTRPCFLVDDFRVILPAYGTYTGGLHCDEPPLSDLLAADAIAIALGQPPKAIPLPSRHKRPRRASIAFAG